MFRDAAVSGGSERYPSATSQRENSWGGGDVEHSHLQEQPSWQPLLQCEVGKRCEVSSDCLFSEEETLGLETGQRRIDEEGVKAGGGEGTVRTARLWFKRQAVETTNHSAISAMRRRFSCVGEAVLLGS